MDNIKIKPNMEGGLEKPTRHNRLENPDFLNEEKFEEELRESLMHVMVVEDVLVYVTLFQHYSILSMNLKPLRLMAYLTGI